MTIVLPNLPNGAKIYVTLETGEVKLLEAETITELGTKTEIINKFYHGLVGESITVNDAADRYLINRRTIVEWCGRGYINILKPGQPGIAMYLDHADVAYCAYVYHHRRGLSGVPLLDQDGNPYRLKKTTRYNIAE